MDNSRRWLLWGPCSGGVYALELAGDRIFHRYDGDAGSQAGDGPEEEYVINFLAHGTDPKGYGGEGIKSAVKEIQALLHGVYRLGNSSYIVFEHGVPIEIYGDLYCDDVGRGGHRCTYGCAGKVTYESDVARAEAVIGGPLIVGEWQYRADHADPYAGQSYALVRRAPLRPFRSDANATSDGRLTRGATGR